MGLGRRKKMWLKCHSKSQHLPSPLLEDALPQGGWSGVLGRPLAPAVPAMGSRDLWSFPPCGMQTALPSRKNTAKLNLPCRTQRCTQAPVQIHRAFPVRPLQPVIILKATIKTVEMHVMGLGSIARLIPTSIPEERR